MRVYVASKFENGEEVRRAHRLLKADKHEITHDWTVESDHGKTGDELLQYRRKCAQADFDGVKTCDVLFLINYARCAGSFTEFGIALALDKYIVVVDGHHPEKARNIFFYMPNVVHVDSVEAAVTLINEWETKRAEEGVEWAK